MKAPLFTPSMMSADLLNLETCIRTIEPVSDFLHFDIMDGHFAPNLTLAPCMVKAVRPATKLPLEAHLMVNNPAPFVRDLIDAGADYITLHAETIVPNAFRLINAIHDAGRKAGIALTPATPIDFAKEYLAMADLVTVMTVDIGYGGQKLIPQMLNKIKGLVRFREERGAHFIIQADGGVNEQTAASFIDAGADMLVLGRGLFRSDISTAESVDRWMEIKKTLTR